MTLHAGAVHKHCRSRYYMAKTPKPIPTVCSPSRNPLKLKLVRSQSIHDAFLTPPRHVCAHAHTHTYTHSRPCAAFICLVPYASTTTSGIWCFRASQSDARPTAIPETLSIEVYTHFLGEHTYTHTHTTRIPAEIQHEHGSDVKFRLDDDDNDRSVGPPRYPSDSLSPSATILPK